RFPYSSFWPHGKPQSPSAHFQSGLPETPELCLPVSENPKSLLDVNEAAEFLGVSSSWVRHHLGELPFIRVGRLIRFDPLLLSIAFQGRTIAGSRLRPERTVPMGYRRYQ